MKRMKLLFACAVMALTLLAVAGTGSAVSKVCSTVGAGAACGGSHGNGYTGSFHLSAKIKAVTTSGFITVSCEEVTITGETTFASIHITSVYAGPCTNNVNGGSCTWSSSASAANKWPGTITTGTAPNGTMTFTNATMSFTCNVLGANRTCNYTASDAVATVTGGAPATIKATSVPLAKEAGSDALCSNTATWSATFTVTTPSNLYLT